MGNKLCAPWRRGYRDEDHPWQHKKDSHLLRLWAEIFEVREEDNDICWARVSDDVVPVNITCIQDNPETVFQITAYNRHVEKIFDVRLIQPGTRITQASECFVHWKDSRCDHEWGLNFTTPVDARRFRDCCMSSAGHNYARKASSSGSLRLSPPKRVKGASRKTNSSPTSPVSKPRRAISSPEDIALQEAPEDPYSLHSGRPPGGTDGHIHEGVYSGIEHIATVPRTRQRDIPHAQSVFPDQNGIHKPSSDVSVYDNVSSLRQQLQRQQEICENPYETVNVAHRPPPHPNTSTMNKPIAVREIPYSQYQSMNHSSTYAATYQSYDTQSTYRSTLYETDLSSGIYSRVDHSAASRSTQQVAHPLEYKEQAQPQVEEDPYGKTELRQFSREPTMLKISDRADRFLETDINDYDNVAAVNKVDNLDTSKVQFDLSPEDSKDTLSPPHKSQSSSSPEWPPPPPDGTLEQLDVTSVARIDSNTLKRMLQSLPESSPTDQDEFQYATIENLSGYQQTTTPSSSPASTMHHHDDTQDGGKTVSGPGPQNSATANIINTDAKPPAGPPKPQRIPLESGSDLAFRSSKSHDSYPDSGVSGLTNDTTGSVRSGDSGRSGKSTRSGKSSTLPAGLGLNTTRSSGGSSGGSSIGRHSDLVRHLGSGSETTEIHHFTSDLSESETESSSEAQESDTSSIKTMPSESQASFASKSAAVRKAGWLTVKNWLMHKKRRIELASKRSWKKYWVCLKGTMLLFYNCDDNESIKDDSVPGHMIVIESGIAQAVPEHPKRENIFALSTAFGDAYLFQAMSQIELENWISAIHSACASSFARQHGKENTLRLLRSEIQKLENSIDLDIKMKKMASLQISVVTDPKSKQAIEKQIAQWDENLEKLCMEQYRLRCYMASLQGSELPNPKTVLAAVSKSTKSTLSRLGVFTVTSFHALVCARSPLTIASLYSTRQKTGLLSTFKADSVTKIRPRSPRSFSPPSSQIYKTVDSEQVLVDLSTNEEESTPQSAPEGHGIYDTMLRLTLPGNQSVLIAVSEKMTVQEVLEAALNKKQLIPNDHFIRLKLPGSDSYKIPDKSSLLQSEEYEMVEVCAKVLFRLELVRSDKERDFGMSIEAELAEDTEQEDELCVFISDIVKGGPAARKGLIVGDEILVINGKVIAELDMVYVENILQETTSVTLTIRSCRTESPVNTTVLMEHADMYIENMTCPPPPSQSRISDKVIDELIVPAPNWVQPEKSDSESGTDPSPRISRDLSQLSSEQIENLLQGAEQVTHFCRLLHSPLTEESTMPEDFPPVKPLSDSQRIRKVIIELIETEKQYVKDLQCLIERYLEPLQEETCLSGEDIQQLFGNIQEIVAFQKLFLLSLQEAVELEPNFNMLTDPVAFKDDDLRRVLFSLAGSFLYYANHFKLYSSFCASHSKAQKVFNADANQQLQDFLRARNPKQQHSSTLESYLIKPIQRILKYPLLLKQLKDLTDPQSDEHHHLCEALRGMEAVAEHINEMQKIYEEYGNIFDELIKQYKEEHKQCLDLNVGELQMYGTVTWLNALDELGKMKKGTDLITLVFIFKAGVVVLAQERIRGKKKTKPPQGRPPTSIEGGDLVRFQLAVPVDQLQVRALVGETERHGVWELIHCRSEKEGRPEKVFQFVSSHEARRDFVKVINNTIRESVRRMSLPGAAVTLSPSGQPQSSQTKSQQNLQQYIPYGSKRPESLVMRGAEKAKGKHTKGELSRHSMEVEDKSAPAQYESVGPDFRTRSQTLTDLNTSDLQYTNCPSGSQSTIASESRSSAKLVHASKNPTSYGGSQMGQRDGLGSPIWKPRHASKRAVVRSPSGEERGLEAGVFSSSAYGDYSNVVYDKNGENRHSSMLLTHPNAYFEHEDTEC